MADQVSPELRILDFDGARRVRQPKSCLAAGVLECLLPGAGLLYVGLVRRSRLVLGATVVLTAALAGLYAALAPHLAHADRDLLTATVVFLPFAGLMARVTLAVDAALAHNRRFPTHPRLARSSTSGRPPVLELALARPAPRAGD